MNSILFTKLLLEKNGKTFIGHSALRQLTNIVEHPIELLRPDVLHELCTEGADALPEPLLAARVLCYRHGLSQLVAFLCRSWLDFDLNCLIALQALVFA